MSFNPGITKQPQEIVFSQKKMTLVIQFYPLIRHEYNDNLLKNILVTF